MSSSVAAAKVHVPARTDATAVSNNRGFPDAGRRDLRRSERCGAKTDTSDREHLQ